MTISQGLKPPTPDRWILVALGRAGSSSACGNWQRWPMSTGSCDPCGWPGENILGKHMDRPYPSIPHRKTRSYHLGVWKKHIWNMVFFPFCYAYRTGNGSDIDCRQIALTSQGGTWSLWTWWASWWCGGVVLWVFLEASTVRQPPTVTNLSWIGSWWDPVAGELWGPLRSHGSP